MKKLNFAVAILFAIVAFCLKNALGQQMPRNLLNVSADQLVIVPDATIKSSTLPDYINNSRRARGLTVLSDEEIRKLLPSNIYKISNGQNVYGNSVEQKNNDPLVGAWRTLVIDRSYLVGDAPPMDILWYWMFSNIENVETRVSDADQINYLPAWVPGEVKNEFLRIIRQGGQIYQKVFIPQGSMFNSTGFNFNGNYTMIDKKVVFFAVDAKTGKRIDKLPFWQMTVRFWNYDYTVGFFRDKVNDVIFGCNNLGLYITKNNAPTKTATLITNQGNNNNDNQNVDKGLGNGNAFRQSQIQQRNPGPSVDYIPPNHCDTINIYDQNTHKLVRQEINCDGRPVTINIYNTNENSVDCCPQQGNTTVVIPPVVVTPNPKPIHVTPIQVTPIQVKPITVTPIITTTVQSQPDNKPCDCDVPLISGNIYGLFDYGVFETSEGGDNTVRFGDFEGSLHINPFKGNMSWLGFSGRLHYFPYMERKIKRGQTELYLFGPSATIRGDNSINRFLLGFARINKRIVYQRYTFELRPWPFEMAMKVEQPEKMTVNGGLGFNWEHFEQDRFSFEIRGTWGFHPYQYFETYGNFLYHFPNSGWSLLGSYWREDQQDFPSAVVNQFNQPLYLIPATISQQAELQVRFPIARKSTSDNSIASAIARKFGQSVAHQGDGNSVTGYGIAQWQNLMSSDYTSRQACLGLGIIFHDFPFERAYVEFRSVYYPADFMMLSEYRPFPAKNPITGLWEENWTRIDSWTRRFDVMVAVSYYF